MFGYGRCQWRRKTWKTHRLVFTWLVGPIPPEMQLDHLCRNRRCCNPTHLELVTGTENTRRGRRTRLTEDLVWTIRALRDFDVIGRGPGQLTIAELAETCGVTPGQIYRILSGQQWIGVEERAGMRGGR